MQLQRTQRVEEHDGAVCVSDPYYLRKRERERRDSICIYIKSAYSFGGRSSFVWGWVFILQR